MSLAPRNFEVEAQVMDRYSGAANARQPCLCCATKYEPKPWRTVEGIEFRQDYRVTTESISPACSIENGKDDLICGSSLSGRTADGSCC